MDTIERIKNSKVKLTDEELTRMAIEELNREVVKARARVEVGQSSYLPACPLKKTNKRFLGNTIRNALHFNRRKGHSTRLKSMKKLIEVEERVENPESAKKPEKFGDRQHIFKKKKKRRKKSPSPSNSTRSSSDSDDEVIILD